MHLHSSGIELVNAAALLLLFLLNLLLVGRQERLKRTEMVRRLKGIISQLSGEATPQIQSNHGRQESPCLSVALLFFPSHEPGGFHLEV